MNSKEIIRLLADGKLDIKDAENQLRKIQIGEETDTVDYPQINKINDEERNGVWSNVIKKFEDNIVKTTVKVQKIDKSIAQIIMCDKDHKNAFSMGLLIGLSQAIKDVENDVECKVIILTGYDNYFACGGNVEGLASLQDGTNRLEDITTFRLGIDCKLPVIAAMQGHAIGGGLCLGLFCDFIVLNRESVYECNHMAFGFTPGDGATLCVPLKFGVSIGNEMLFSGKRFYGHELEDKGVPIPVLSKKDVVKYAIDLAKDISVANRDSLILLKKHISKKIKKQLDEIYQDECNMQKVTFVGNSEALSKIKVRFKVEEGNVNNIKKDSDKDILEQIKTREKDDASLHGNDGRKHAVKGNQYATIDKMNKSKSGRPIIWVHGEIGLSGYQLIADGCKRPFYGINSNGINNISDSIDTITTRYVELIRTIQPNGPYDLGGYSIGGYLAFDIARKLQLDGESVKTIVLVDTFSNATMQSVIRSKKANLMRAVNITIAFRKKLQPNECVDKLISRDELDVNIDEDMFLRRMISIGIKRGLSLTKTENELFMMFKRSQILFEVVASDNHLLKQLEKPNEIKCLYLRNGSNRLFNDNLEMFFNTRKNEYIDSLQNEAVKWKEYLPDTEVVDIDSTNHLLMTVEKKAIDQVKQKCAEIYNVNDHCKKVEKHKKIVKNSSSNKGTEMSVKKSVTNGDVKKQKKTVAIDVKQIDGTYRKKINSKE